MALTGQIHDALMNKETVVSAFLDKKSAIDSIPHEAVKNFMILSKYKSNDLQIV